jgi:hypothetical protein
VRHQSSRTDGSPSGRSMLVSGRDPVCHRQVSRFGWNRRFPVPAMHASGAGGPFGSRIAEGNRPSRRAASLNRMADPRDHGSSRAIKNALRGEKNLDPEHSRLEPFILVGEWERADTALDSSTLALSHSPTNGQIAKVLDLCWGPGATPLVRVSGRSPELSRQQCPDRFQFRQRLHQH